MRLLPALLLAAAPCVGRLLGTAPRVAAGLAAPPSHSTSNSGTVRARGLWHRQCSDAACTKCCEVNTANCSSWIFILDQCFVANNGGGPFSVLIGSCAAEGAVEKVYPVNVTNCSGESRTETQAVDQCEFDPSTGYWFIDECIGPPAPPPPPTPPPAPPGTPAKVRLYHSDGSGAASVRVPDAAAGTAFTPNYNSGRRGALGWDVCGGSAGGNQSNTTFSDGQPVWTKAAGSQVAAFKVTGKGSIVVSASCLQSFSYSDATFNGTYSAADGRVSVGHWLLAPSYFEIKSGPPPAR